MIIGFCGRLRSGKSELAKICTEHGYKKLSFALPLKNLCADILDTSVEELNQLKNNNAQLNITIYKDICDIIHNETNIPLNIIQEICLNKTIKTVRHMLQFIGTDLIRKYNEDWHVNRLKELMQNDENYVFDDVRFQNEKHMIEELGGDCWYVVRPNINNISNHISETSITWHNCYNKIIINNSTLPYLKFKWEAFMDNYKQSCIIREKHFNDILNYGINELEKDSLNEMMFLDKYMFTYVPRDVEKNDVKNIVMNKDKSIFITYQDDSMELIDNPLNIEDLKIIL